MKSNTISLENKNHRFGGTVRAIASKSHAHRLLISAALSSSAVTMITPDSSKDIEATVNCLTGLGAEISRTSDSYFIKPISPLGAVNSKNSENSESTLSIDSGESGSTLRFIIPVIGALGINCDIFMHGRLSERPLSPMYEELISHGLTMSPQGSNPLHIEGKLNGGTYTIAGNISSQFITGLLFALPLIEEDSVLHVTGRLESRPYDDITLKVLKDSRIDIVETKARNSDTIFNIKGRQKYHCPDVVYAEGDWSNAAFFLSAGAIGDSPVTVTGLNIHSLQGDKKILSILESFGARVTMDANQTSITVSPANLHGTEIDATDIPDLVPIISAVASVASGKTVIRNVERLRIKESDRVQTVVGTLSTLGANIYEANDAIIIHGIPSLRGGTVDSCNDHRIAMTSAIASIRCKEPVTITNCQAVEKSYPGFYEDFQSLNGNP